MTILFPIKTSKLTFKKSILGGSIFISWFPVIVFVIIQSLPNQHEHTQVSNTNLVSSICSIQLKWTNHSQNDTYIFYNSAYLCPWTLDLMGAFRTFSN